MVLWLVSVVQLGPLVGVTTTVTARFKVSLNSLSHGVARWGLVVVVGPVASMGSEVYVPIGRMVR